MVVTAILPDLPTTEDHLDFGASAAALAGIVGDEGTTTPITVGVFGTWGTGKTSLMRMIEAARGSDGRQYPWGDEFDPEWANVRESGVGGTTPVGVHPDGASPYGLLDCAGNVWEWTTSRVGEDQIVICGGSRNFHADDARCFSRDYSHPHHRSNRIGFRVVTGPRPIADSGEPTVEG